MTLNDRRDYISTQTARLEEAFYKEEDLSHFPHSRAVKYSRISLDILIACSRHTI